MWTIIAIIFVACSIFTIFWTSFVEESGVELHDVVSVLIKIVTFIPMLVIGAVLIMAGDFKNHRLGYIVLLLFIALIIFAVVKGIQAGPSSPAPWDS